VARKSLAVLGKPPFSAADFIEAHKVFRFEEVLEAHTEPDRDLLCSRLSRDAVLAYEGALAFHGLVTLGNSLSFLTNERPRDPTVRTAALINWSAAGTAVVIVPPRT